MNYPTREEAEKIWQKGIDYSREHQTKTPQIDKEYIFHSRGVADFSARLAEKMGLNKDKAYVLGLLHDYGKRIDEKRSDKFHGIVGYEDFMEYGYSDVAKICLTHTFNNKNFHNEDFSYPSHWLDECRQLLNNITYDDYDRIVQYADMFFEGMEITSLENRIAGITQRYNLNELQQNMLKNGVFKLKKYIDDKCCCDSYEVLGIKR